MPVQVDPTPNPNAMKFTVGVPVGGPATFVAGSEVPDPGAARLLALEGVVSVFMTADFVTLTKEPGADWEPISREASTILEEHFPAE